MLHEEEYSVLDDIFGTETAGLMRGFISHIKADNDRRAYLNALVEFGICTGEDPLKARVEHFTGYVRHLTDLSNSGKLKYSTVAKRYKMVASFMSYCDGLKGMDGSPVPRDFINNMRFAPLKCPDDVFRREKIPTFPELDKLIGWLKANDRLTLLAVLLCLRCLLKMGDIINLRTGNIYKDSSDACFLSSPAREHLVLVPEDVAELIEERFADLCDNDYIFSSKRSKHLCSARLNARLADACSACGVSYTFNDLRNCGAVYASSNGATEEELSDAMGYRTPAHIGKLSSLKLNAKSVDPLINIYLK